MRAYNVRKWTELSAIRVAGILTQKISMHLRIRLTGQYAKHRKSTRGLHGRWIQARCDSANLQHPLLQIVPGYPPEWLAEALELEMRMQIGNVKDGLRTVCAVS